ncbi:CapA family protein [Paenibacillus senegalimassiliensis]|uniref:CapA family protein n=1 Tax=Paenibacillus senegalimassiliensis TaxID=1737426 RepID=UPI00073F6BE9|nr:CapA family protein [Paenibacillus senegalimassiliensis]
MYPPRSQKNKQKQQENRRIQNRIWLLLNLTLLTLIFVLGAYFYVEVRTQQRGVETGATESLPPLEYVDDGLAYLGGETGEEESTGHVEEQKANEPNREEEASAGNEGEEGSEPVAPYEPPADAPKNSAEAGEHLLIHFVGDTMFSGKVQERLEKKGYDFPYEYIRELFEQDDLTLLNLETPVTEGGQPAENKTYVFKSPTRALAPMAKAGVDAVGLANNHILDQGISGLKDTLKALKEHDIAYAGAGHDAKDAYAPVYLERKGIKVALLSFSRVVPESTWVAGANHAGVASAYTPKRALEEIRTAKENADLVLVMSHWGKERTTVLEDHQQELAHAYIDAGADLVIGSHPHVMQGLEQYQGKWIVYSTGNFIFTKSKDPKTWETAVFSAVFTKEGECSLRLIPYRTELGQPVLMNAEDGGKLLREIAEMSPGVRIADTGEVFG